ncbi:hypothetical protein Lalb_Chr08g0233131 [Lupinus albus]|uniref:Transmembrane protein n=1 Tax=Lupinus albus TaxID=3870 RepID=A0A6A4Q394_LUPAL|nr:hypothetical protein Lalb_Chr08g0233131 [Lupinus albus]
MTYLNKHRLIRSSLLVVVVVVVVVVVAFDGKDSDGIQGNGDKEVDVVGGNGECDRQSDWKMKTNIGSFTPRPRLHVMNNCDQRFFINMILHFEQKQT